MARVQWKDLSPDTRRMIIIGATIEGALKFAALAELRGRPRSQVRGSKTLWAMAISFINAFGAVPVLYFLVGRRTPLHELPDDPEVAVEVA
jgi:hypothetical protein